MLLCDHNLWSLLKLCLAVASSGVMCDFNVPLLFTLMPRYVVVFMGLTNSVFGASGVKKKMGLGEGSFICSIHVL